MSEKEKRPIVVVRPRYDPDPQVTYDPDPLGVTAFIILSLIGVAGLGVGTNPNLLNNAILALNPKLAEQDFEKERLRQETMQDLFKLIGAIAVAVSLVSLIYIFWRWKVRKKEMKAFRRRRRR